MMYEMCDCGHLGGNKEGVHKAQIAYGHGACTECNCPQFTWMYFCDKDGNKLTHEQVMEDID
jgi:hypothetical protein